MENVQHDLSYVQVDTFERCPRKWGFEWLDGVVGPKNKFAAFGILGHDVVAKWLRKREFNWSPAVSVEDQGKGIKPQDVAAVAQEIVKLLPTPQAVNPENVEINLGIQLGGLRFVGAIDLFVEGKTPTIYDHKFVTSFRFVLEEQAFENDIQATLYAAYALLRTGAAEVNVQWTYGRREKPPQARAVRRTLTGADIRDRVSRTVETGRQIQLVVRSGLHALDLPFNPSACEEFGGCPYRHLCNLKPEETVEAIMTQGSATKSFLEKLKARTNGQPVEQPINPPAPAAPPSASGGLAAKMAAKRADPPPVVDEPAAEEPKRGPGRPRKEAAATTSPLEAAWSAYAASALGSMVTIDVSVGEPGPEDAASLAAQYADAMLKQHQAAGRFPRD